VGVFGTLAGQFFSLVRSMPISYTAKMSWGTNYKHIVQHDRHPERRF